MFFFLNRVDLENISKKVGDAEVWMRIVGAQILLPILEGMEV